MHVSSPARAKRLAESAPVTYVIFDLLWLDGHSLMASSYAARRHSLAELALSGERWQAPEHIVGQGRATLEASREAGLEGIVAKRLDSRYHPGRRTGDWVKLKNMRREQLIIGGWMRGSGRRSKQVGALLIGQRDEAGALRYAGRVGTGFSERDLEGLSAQLASRSRRSSPFDAQGVQPPRDAHFAEPELVAEIEFSDWTRQRILRHASYKGLRTDKPAEQVVREDPAVPAPAPGSPARKAAAPVSPHRELAEAETAGQSRPYEVVRETRRFTEIEVQSRRLRLSNREKVLYPRAGFTKGQMVDYYAAVAPALLGHLAGRPLTLKRYPNGVEEKYFYEKRCPSHRPEWVQTAAVWSERQKETIDYCLVEDLPTLIWLANLADIELHTSLSQARDMDTPTSLVFDLDPGAPAGLRECARVALWIRDLLDVFALQTFVKTSGSKGLQVYLPLNTPVSYEQTKPFAHAVAMLLEKRHPRLVVSRMAKSERAGRVLIDWSQNDPHKTTVCVYSLRARERPTISTPLSWEEVGRASRRRRESELNLEPQALLERLAREGDPFAPLLSLTQRLPELSSA
jgi:bifunctional non-homologous end joining protein LigD